MAQCVRLPLFVCYALSISLALQVTSIHSWSGSTEGLQSVYSAILPQLMCPSPFELEGERCTFLNVAEPTFSCAKQTGYFENGKCVTLTEAAATLKCPDNAEFDGKKCVLSESRPPTVFCPRGFSANVDATGCISEHTRKSHLKCPHGYVLRNDECTKEHILPATPICPEGYVIQTNGYNRGAECVQVEIIGQKAFCPKDHEIVENLCIFRKSAERVPYCPPGYSNDGEFCSKTHRVEPDIVCAQGELSTNGKDCVIMEFQEPLLSCRKDLILDGDRCVKIHESEVQYGCGNGSKLIDNKCVSHESMAPEFSCKEGTVLSDKNCILEEELPLSYKCTKGELSPTKICLLNEKTKFHSACPEGYTKHDDKCISTHSVKAEITCESGELEGKFCVSHISIPAEKYCKDSREELIDGMCIMKTKKNIQLNCSEGYKLQGDKCFINIEDSIEQQCLPGTTIRGKVCESHEIVLPLLSCPKNFVMDSSGNCFMSEFAEPILTCSEGLRMVQGKCVPFIKYSKLRSS